MSQVDNKHIIAQEFIIHEALLKKQAVLGQLMDGPKPLGFLEVMQKISSTFESLFIHQNQILDAPTYSYNNIIVAIRMIVQTFTCTCSIMIGTKSITCTMTCDHQAFCRLQYTSHSLCPG